MSGVPADFHGGDILGIKTALPSRYVGALALPCASRRQSDAMRLD